MKKKFFIYFFFPLVKNFQFSWKKFLLQIFFPLQIVKPKVGLFCPNSKNRPDNPKIWKFQNYPEIALVDEFHRNLRQTKGLGLIFQKKLKFCIFDDISSFYSTLNMDQIRHFEKVKNSQIYYDFKSLRLFYEWIFFKNFFLTFFYSI